MAFGDSSIANNLASSVTGSVGKAYVLLCDPNSSQYNRISGIRKRSQGGRSRESLVQLAKKLNRGVLESGDRKMGYSAILGADRKLQETASDSGYIPVRVQYNPNSLSLTGQGGAIRQKGVGGGAFADFLQYEAPSEVSLGVELLFDDTDPVNAFPATSVCAENLVRRGIGKAASLAARREREYSVQDISELFVAAIMDCRTRQAGFVWNKMLFWGELTEAAVQFTLFNRLGDPIRSKVSLRIRQETKKDTYWAYYWEEAFQAFVSFDKNHPPDSGR